MPRVHSFPTLFDECKTVSISELKKWGYLKPNQFLTGVLTWRRGGEKTGSISIGVRTWSEQPSIEFNYTSNGKPVKYEVKIVSFPSNLGKGYIKYFLCPKTGKRCRKLYLGDTFFYHRSAFTGCMYDIQTQSHRNRGLIKQLVKVQKRENSYEQLYKKYFKKYYRGKPTKRYLKVIKHLRQGEGISLGDLIML